MEPADNNNQNPGATPDLEKLANELSQVAASTPSPELSAPTPVSIPEPGVDSASTSSPAPSINPAPASPTNPTATPIPEPTTLSTSSATPVTPSVSPEPAPASFTPESSTTTPSVDFTSPVSTVSATPESSLDTMSTANSLTNPSIDPSSPASPAPQQPTPPVDNPPLQPAAPVPGSIGSAHSYVDPSLQAQPQPQLNATPAQKPKFNRTTILIIILAAVVLIGGIALAVILLTSNSNKSTVTSGNSTYVPVPQNTDPVITNLVCVAPAADPAYLESIGNPTAFSDSINLSFIDDEMSTYTHKVDATYETPEAASANLNIIQSKYNEYISTLLPNSTDPLVSSYSYANNIASASHSVREDNITLDAATYIGLDTSKATDIADLDLSRSAFQTLYSGLNYTCTEVEDTTDTTDTTDSATPANSNSSITPTDSTTPSSPTDTTAE